MIRLARYIHVAPHLSSMIDRVLINTVVDWKNGAFPSLYSSFQFNFRVLHAALSAHIYGVLP